MVLIIHVSNVVFFTQHQHQHNKTNQLLGWKYTLSWFYNGMIHQVAVCLFFREEGFWLPLIQHLPNIFYFTVTVPITRFHQLIVSWGTCLTINSKAVQFQLWTYLTISKCSTTKACGSAVQGATLGSSWLLVRHSRQMSWLIFFIMTLSLARDHTSQEKVKKQTKTKQSPPVVEQCLWFMVTYRRQLDARHLQ